MSGFEEPFTSNDLFDLFEYECNPLHLGLLSPKALSRYNYLPQRPPFVNPRNS